METTERLQVTMEAITPAAWMAHALGVEPERFLDQCEVAVECAEGSPDPLKILDSAILTAAFVASNLGICQKHFMERCDAAKTGFDDMRDQILRAEEN